MFKTLIITATIFVLCLAFSTSNEAAYKVLESATPGILGAILGGLTAGVSVIFSVLITAAASSGSADRIKRFNVFLDSLKKDIVILVVCLVVSLLLPYFRITGLPLLTYPSDHALIPSRDSFFTAIELTAIVIAVAIIVEVVNVMFSLISQLPSLLGATPKDE
ncbi:hypothetical protein M2G59_08900 [Vibrio vulnificus]|uniref:hypothetical protein n=1 Tax=Vibrio vulnificus TaxID=672 RepID=UPI0005C47D18|nr:hypothetical protein [Vibrio vulnificus]EGR0040709.1 hypothetical protein [Vibrio vulnificus]EGR0093550.1 hypothetical protein [Vibrio vulnificus]EGR0096824.1 hypothetical protein [Vibrio vulnificus]EGR7941745.1 hypothetical protein [Vibrio vulnificus]EHU9439331.1 hypothetical protein [Vibrio vulnificus]